MHSLEGIIAMNKQGVLREFHDAIESGAWELAAKIKAANPDLFAKKGEPNAPDPQH